jgi:hypothetical protein
MNGFHFTPARLATKKLGTALALLVLAVAPALAQINSGSMSGTVSDTTGAVIPNAKITATEAQTGTVYNTVANSAGIYTLPTLLPGTYTVKVIAQSFKEEDVKGVLVAVSNRTGRDFTLQPGDSETTVTVEANGPALDTQSSDVGTSISQQQVEDLPIPTGSALRSLTTLTFLTPGAVGPGTNGGTVYTKIGGGQTFGSDNLIDGLSTQRSENGTGFFDQMTPSVDAIGRSSGLLWPHHRRHRQLQDQVRHQRLSRHCLRLLPQHHLRRQQLLQ